MPSGDSLVLRNRPAPGQAAKERVLHLADITSPRAGSASREDEPWSYEARDFLRSLTVGKEVTFTSIHSLPPNDDVPRDLGYAQIAGQDLSTELLKNGWAKLKELKRDPTDEDNAKRDVENEAKAAGKGLWNPHGPQVRTILCSPMILDPECYPKARTVHYTMPADSLGFVNEWKGKPIDGMNFFKSR